MLKYRRKRKKKEQHVVLLHTLYTHTLSLDTPTTDNGYLIKISFFGRCERPLSKNVCSFPFG